MGSERTRPLVAFAAVLLSAGALTTVQAVRSSAEMLVAPSFDDVLGAIALGTAPKEPTAPRERDETVVADAEDRVADAVPDEVQEVDQGVVSAVDVDVMQESGTRAHPGAPANAGARPEPVSRARRKTTATPGRQAASRDHAGATAGKGQDTVPTPVQSDAHPAQPSAPAAVPPGQVKHGGPRSHHGSGDRPGKGHGHQAKNHEAKGGHEAKDHETKDHQTRGHESSGHPGKHRGHEPTSHPGRHQGHGHADHPGKGKGPGKGKSQGPGKGHGKAEGQGKSKGHIKHPGKGSDRGRGRH